MVFPTHHRHLIETQCCNVLQCSNSFKRGVRRPAIFRARPMKSPRRPQDINQRFDKTVAPCNCGPAMRFELEAFALHTEHDATLDQAALLVAWRYKLAPKETTQYFDAISGLRMPH